ncbi:hypothetical protein OPV22_019563 [Ensete ventricosum]|uniref:tRNA pseudouridine(55) synthase n=1 Tax=Ensete ventricosum TaxID=4639 RepID=A0AAV8P8Z5_ENSVE|nr:hypothetical protein OPV22_019563 [Ensete ventricosum]
MAITKGLSSLFFSSSSGFKPLLFLKAPPAPFPSYHRRGFSFTATPYPLYYELVGYRPARRRRPNAHEAASDHLPSTSPDDDAAESAAQERPAMDRSKRRYYRKRQRRMYGGSDSEDDKRGGAGDGFVELKPEVIDFPRLHAREEELYFYDAFAYPWEKEKHYRMVYQLEKKYFPQYSLDNAFIDPSAKPVPSASSEEGAEKKKGRKSGKSKKEKDDREERDERALIFFEETEEQKKEKPASGGVTEKKVEEFFKCLTNGPKAGDRQKAVATNTKDQGEPYLVSRKTELPPRWDGPSGTVVLVDKPKGWTSFTVCGKLRRLVKVQKVGHAGTLDPMATGLLIVCVGKATKLVERYQGMIKGYSGVFRLGEATSTWDADSPVIQREPWEHIKDEDIKKAAAPFLGEILQVPPMFSAIKVGGEKMYEKARRGEMIELSPRRISIYDFAIARSLDDRQNLIFRVTCSKGTYIRSLCADFGKALGSCAHLTALRRDSIGEFSADDAWTFSCLLCHCLHGHELLKLQVVAPALDELVRLHVDVFFTFTAATATADTRLHCDGLIVWGLLVEAQYGFLLEHHLKVRKARTGVHGRRPGLTAFLEPDMVAHDCRPGLIIFLEPDMVAHDRHPGLTIFLEPDMVARRVLRVGKHLVERLTVCLPVLLCLLLGFLYIG